MMRPFALFAPVALLPLLACTTASAPAPESAAPAPPPETAPPEPVAPEPSAAPEPALPEPAASAEPPAEPPPAPSIHDRCLEMCEKVAAKCPKSAAQSCRVNCGKYESPTAGCEPLVHEALACARDAADLVCANVAPESCAKKFRALSACNAGAPSAAEESKTELPAGFVVFEESAAGFSAPMPGPVAHDASAPSWTAEHPSGATYSVRKLPLPNEPRLTEKVFLRLSMKLFGRCSDKLKLFGIVEKPGRTSIHYSMKCPDGSEERGVYFATARELFLASVHGRPGTLGDADAMLYGFEAK